jgi:hypothetical protein
MQRNWKKERSLEEGVSEKAYLLDPTEDLILLSDELDVDLSVDLPEMDTENEHAQPVEEEEEIEVGYRLSRER